MRQYPLLHIIPLVLAALLLSGGEGARGQPSDQERAAIVRAGMVVNFIRYTRWPAASFEHERSPIVVTLVGDDEIEDALSAALRGETIGGRAVVVRRRWYPPVWRGELLPRAEDLDAFYEDLRTSHVAYFGASERQRVEEHLRKMGGPNVLTVSAIPRFAERGGMLGLVVRDRRIAFDANIDAINETEMRVSSQVLNLARIVRGPTHRAEERDPEGTP